MKIAVRVDASCEMGSGHFMRCLTLASSLRGKSFELAFVSRDLPQFMVRMLGNADIAYYSLESSEAKSDSELKHSDWLKASQHSDARQTLSALAGSRWDWMIVDHYALDYRWEALLRPAVNKIMVIDDLADRLHDCDVLLDQNLYPNILSRYDKKTPKNCNLLLGPKYALLRDEFLTFRKITPPRSGEVNRVLIFLGGFDYDNYTTLVIRALSSLELPELRVDVVIGEGHPFRREVQKLCIELGYNCHIQTSHIAELMSQADFSIGAGGSATWERCSLGLPSCILTLADNQIAIAKEVSEQGASVYLGLASEINFQKLRECLAHHIGDRSNLARISEQAYTLVDGRGVERVCNAIEMEC